MLCPNVHMCFLNYYKILILHFFYEDFNIFRKFEEDED